MTAMKQNLLLRQLTHQVCSRCGRDLPISHFERYPTGTYRRVCNQCKYEHYTRPAKLRYVLRHLEDDR